jgi:4-hydroxybenzoate polyprenyltransferase
MATKAKKKEEPVQAEVKWPFGPRNYLVFGAAMLTIILGYIALGKGSITLAPILLVLGYCVLVPVALIIKGKPDEEKSEAAESQS